MKVNNKKILHTTKMSSKYKPLPSCSGETQTVQWQMKKVAFWGDGSGKGVRFAYGDNNSRWCKQPK